MPAFEHLCGLNKRMHTKPSAQDLAHWKCTEHIKYYHICSRPHLWSWHAVQMQPKHLTFLMPSQGFSLWHLERPCLCMQLRSTRDLAPSVSRGEGRTLPSLPPVDGSEKCFTNQVLWMQWAMGIYPAAWGWLSLIPRHFTLLLFWVPFLNQPVCEPLSQVLLLGNPG